MLILCYGITKSGSTLAFELVKGILESAGHPQLRLSEDVINPGHRINYIQPLDRRRLNRLIEAIGERWIAVKTHAGFVDALFPYLEKMEKKGRLRVIASYRDPREICLSLIDAGVVSRAAGKKEFSEVRDLDSAIPRVSEQIVKFRKWAALHNTLRLDYDTVAFDTDEAIDRIEQSLGIVGNRDQAKQHAFAGAFTQKNRAQRHRARKELTPEQDAKLRKAFAAFLENVYEKNDDGWFSSQRETILTKLEAQRSPA